MVTAIRAYKRVKTVRKQIPRDAQSRNAGVLHPADTTQRNETRETYFIFLLRKANVMSRKSVMRRHVRVAGSGRVTSSFLLVVRLRQRSLCRHNVRVVVEPRVPVRRDFEAVEIAVLRIFHPSMTTVRLGFVLEVLIAELILVNCGNADSNTICNAHHRQNTHRAPYRRIAHEREARRSRTKAVHGAHLFIFIARTVPHTPRQRASATRARMVPAMAATGKSLPR